VLCICAHAPELALATHVTVLMHWREVAKTTNTGRLIRLVSTNSQVQIRGDRRIPFDARTLLSPERQPLLLFPTQDAILLTPEFTHQFERPIHLIVPDGNWNQARKVATRETALKGVPRVTLPPGPPSRYALRRSPQDGHLATLEAIARAIGILEGAETQTRIEEFLDLMIERVLWSRGKLPTSECRFGIPQEAVDAFYRDGCAGAPHPPRPPESSSL
jgi:DTW domain-containing protein YfiP